MRLLASLVCLAFAACGGSDQSDLGSTESPAISQAALKASEFPWKYDGSTSRDERCKLKGAYRRPVADTDARITQTFDELSSEPKALQYHTGVDFARAGEQKEIAAMTIGRGRVVGVFDSDAYRIINGALVPSKSTKGRFQGVVLLKHTPESGLPFWSLYGHLNARLLAKNGAARFGDCVPAGEPVGVSGLFDGVHHLHLEVKRGPVDTQPTRSDAPCAAGTACWGYTYAHPQSHGYSNPLDLLLKSTLAPSGSTFEVREGGYRFNSVPALKSTDRDSSYGVTVLGSILQVTHVAQTPNAEMCAADWYRVQIVENADCKVAGQCFQQNAKTVRASVPSAWVCGAAGVYKSPLQPVFQRLNDTGIPRSECFANGTDAIVDCASAEANALSQTQDGMIGRDVSSPDGADGYLGFSFKVIRKAEGQTYPSTDCVRDRLTGLVWESKTRDGSIRDASQRFSNLGGPFSRADASDLIASVNGERLCGFSDWRLPTAVELESIVHYGQADALPLIEPTWFGNAGLGKHWTSTPFPGASGSDAVQVDFSDGSVYYGSGRSNTYFVRLVRGPCVEAPCPTVTPRFTVLEGGAVLLDNLTLLQWKRCSEGQVWSGTECIGNPIRVSHEAALRVNQSAGWRLPNIRELWSIIDLALVGPAIDAGLFPLPSDVPAHQTLYWSSTPAARSPGVARGVLLHGGYVEPRSRSDAGLVRLVR